MPMIDADGCLLNVSVEGRDGGPTLMLSNSLGATMQMWEPQMKALTQVFRVIRYDRRGHGKSQVPPGPYSMERFGRDVLAILDAPEHGQHIAVGKLDLAGVAELQTAEFVAGRAAPRQRRGLDPRRVRPGPARRRR
mgnify:CR=1 FL=1